MRTPLVNARHLLDPRVHEDRHQGSRLGRDRDGRYHLVAGQAGVTAIVGDLYHDPNEGT